MERVAAPTAASREEPCPGCGHATAEARCGGCGTLLRVRDFQVRRVVSRSPHGRLYLAEDGAGRRVALKELVFALVPDVQQLEAFEREAAILSALDVPGVPRFVASFREGEGVHTRLYFAQEFVDGESLLARIERGPLAVPEWTRIAEALLDVLVLLHGRVPQVLHRDLKPANVILRPDGRVALVDFGAARHLQTSVTHGATLVGTFGYMAPEQLGGTVNARSDLYGLGATLVHLITREPPASSMGPDLALRLPRHTKLSSHLRAFLGKLCAARPSDRFASAQDALAFLHLPWYRRPFGRRALMATGLTGAVLATAATFFPQTFDLASYWRDQLGPAQHVTVRSGVVSLGLSISSPYSPFDVQLVSAWRGESSGGVTPVTVRIEVKNHTADPARPDLSALLAGFELLGDDGTAIPMAVPRERTSSLRPAQSLVVDLQFSVPNTQFPLSLRARGKPGGVPIRF